MSGSRHDNPSVVADTFAGFAAGFVSTIVCHPLDLIKTRLQVDRHVKLKRWGSFAVATQILEEGRAAGGSSLKVMYRGLVPNVVGNTASWGLYFLWYGQFKSAMARYRGRQGQDLSSIDYLVTSGAAGVASAVLTNPLWVVKTRMLSTGSGSPGAYRGLLQGLGRLTAHEGVRGLYRGFLPSLFGVLQAAIQFMTYEKLKIWRRDRRLESSEQTLKSRLLNDRRQQHSSAVVPSDDAKHQERSHATSVVGQQRNNHTEHAISTPASTISPHILSNVDFMILSALSKVFSGVLTYPYQVIRSRLQTHDAATVYSSARNAVAQTWRDQGIAGFYRGLGPNLIRVLPATCITFVVYENARLLL